MKTMLVLLALLAAMATVSPKCDFCALDNGFTLPWAKPFDNREYPACKQYKDNACCSYDTVQGIVNGSLYGSGEYNINKCSRVGKPLSNKCFDFFVQEQCAYECDPNFGKYRRHDSCDPDLSWQLFNLPLKASLCQDWYSACKDDYIPSCGSQGGVPCNASASLFAGSALSVGMINATNATCSRTFGDIFGRFGNPAQTFCNQLYENAFMYQPFEQDGFVFDFPVGDANPNDRTNAHLNIDVKCKNIPKPDPSTCPGAARPDDVIPSGCTVCQVRNIHPNGTVTKDVATKETTNLGVCQKYANNSCCSPSVAELVPKGRLYGDQYTWDRCDSIPTQSYSMSEKCRQWFRDELCLYECDAQVGKYRKWPKCVTSQGDPNAWQIEAMPIKATECDAWYNDCKNDYFCACLEGECPKGVAPRSFFSLTKVDCNKDTCRTFGSLFTNGSDLCETLWDGSFMYEPNEEDAYSMAWSPNKTGGINPNSLVNAYVTFPDTCPGAKIDLTQCPSQQEPEIPLEVVDNIILNQLNDTDLAIINQAVAQAAQRGNGSTAVTSTSNNQG